MGMVVDRSLLESLRSPIQRGGIIGVPITPTAGHVANFNNSRLHENTKGVPAKSQLLFKDKPDNSYLPFVSKLRQKPNALVPLPGTYANITSYCFFVHLLT